jgi:tRNA (guanine10-N2)-dimethyltransferase
VLLFSRLSGDNADLGMGEARALCDARTGTSSVVEYNPPALVIECGGDVNLGALGGFILESGQLVWRGSAEEFDAREMEVPVMDGPVKADAEGFGQEHNLRIARDLGELMVETGMAVDVRKPRSVLRAYRVGDRVYVAAVRHVRAKWKSRDIRSRPFRHPSMLTPRFARALVNLSRPRVGGILLDPFSGTGGVLLEAQEVGCLPLGVDLDWRMARGALRNIGWAGSTGGIVRGDSRALPVNRSDCVASDLPYGRMSSSMGSTTDELLASIVEELPGILGPGGYAALMVRERVPGVRAGGVDLVETYLHRVHDALTRKIFVYRVTGS